MMKYPVLFALLVLAPYFFGLPWTKVIKARYASAFAYSTGFFMEQVLFFLFAFPARIFRISFHTVVWAYSAILCLGCLICLWMSWQRLMLSRKTYRDWKRFEWYEWILMAGLTVSIGFQVYRGIVGDITLRTYDDYYYTVIAVDTLNSDLIGGISATGEATYYLEASRMGQTSLIFPAYLSAVSGISVPTIEHTIQYVQMIMLAYITYTYMAGELFPNRMDRLIFLLLLSMTYLFGYYNHYSYTLRLLGANYQGKMIMTASLMPLIMTVLSRMLSQPYRWQNGLLLLLLSVGSVAMTLFGAVNITVILVAIVVISLLRKKREWKHLFYLLWGCSVPMLFGGIYLFFKYTI